MEYEENKTIKKANVDVAINRIKVPILLIVISLATYIIPLVFGAFDFGIVFELISFFFLLLSRAYMSIYDENKARLYIIFSMIAIGCILAYDIILFFASIKDVADLALFSYDYYISELLIIFYFITLVDIYSCLSKSVNPKKYKKRTEWFYEKNEMKGKK